MRQVLAAVPQKVEAGRISWPQLTAGEEQFLQWYTGVYGRK